MSPPETYDLSKTGDFVYAFSLGLQKSFGEFKYWQASGEAYYNSNGYGRNPPVGFLLQEGLFNPLYTGKLYGSISLRKSNLFGNTNITGSASLLSNLSDLSYNAYTSLAFAFPRLVPFTLRLSYADGRDGTAFDPDGEGSLTTSVYTKVSF